MDWNKVAHHPILQQEISNGHAARMRYSRFKKQMDGTTTIRKPRNPNSPRKIKVDKNKSPKKEKVKNQKESNEAEKIKEEVGVAGWSHHTPVEGTPEAGSQPSGMEDSFHGSVESSPFVKIEPGSSNGSRYASAPLDESTTPASSFHSGAGDMSDVDKMYPTFGMPDGNYMADPMMAQGVIAPQQYGMGMHIGMGGSYQGLWGEHHIQAEGGAMIKRKSSWEQTYHQV
jgi:hypothetical protein